MALESAAFREVRVVFTLADLERTRNHPGKSCLVFLTDRCPVGCAHCSVDSRPDSPRIEDQGLFREVVAGVLSVPSFDVIGVSGGEPFIERRALSYLVEECSIRGLQVVLYTSGVWASKGKPYWVYEVLERAASVVLSTDAFHTRALNMEALDRAAGMVLDAGCSLIVQTVDLPSSRQPALRFVERMMKSAPDRNVELNLVPPLSVGRGRVAFASLPPLPRRTLTEWGSCRLLGAPVIRYDGMVVACCNEAILMGAGPDRLRRRCKTRAEVVEAITALRSDPLLECMRTVGVSTIGQLPWVDVPADRSYGSICEACWELNVQFDTAGESDRRTLRALSALFGAVQPQL
jgi:MoaA/NifB/PqqE/SkfB family radical SAM enzyme